MQIRQLDISESYGLIIFCDFKGRVCVFRLNEFSQIMSDSNWDQSLTKTKLDCKEHKLDFISSCHTYAISKQPISNKNNNNNTLKILAACGKKLILFHLRNQQCSAAKMCSACSAFVGNNSTKSASNSNSKSNLNKSSSAQNLAYTDFFNDVSSLFQIKKVALKIK